MDGHHQAATEKPKPGPLAILAEVALDQSKLTLSTISTKTINLGQDPIPMESDRNEASSFTEQHTNPHTDHMEEACSAPSAPAADQTTDDHDPADAASFLEDAADGHQNAPAAAPLSPEPLPSQAVALALESLTEQSAMEILSPSDSLSESTAKVIAQVAGLSSPNQDLAVDVGPEHLGEEESVQSNDSDHLTESPQSLDRNDTHPMEDVLDEFVEETDDKAKSIRLHLSSVDDEVDPDEHMADHSQDSLAQDTPLSKSDLDSDLNQTNINGNSCQSPACPTRRVRKRRRISLEMSKKKKKQKTKKPTAAARVAPPDAAVDSGKAQALGGPHFKPVTNWRKVLKLPQNYTDLSMKLLEHQLYRNLLPPYVPCVPRNTSQRLIENLSHNDLDQIRCPGCNDRFLIPSCFMQHLYRKSVRIIFTCSPCGGNNLTFYNRCHLRTHVLSHLEADVASMPNPEFISVSALEPFELDVGSVSDDFKHELDQLHQEHFAQRSEFVQCSECRVSLNKAQLSQHFQKLTGCQGVDCSVCSMQLSNACALAAHIRIHRKAMPFVCPECGISLETWSMFRHHVTAGCQHESRVLTVQCDLCVKASRRSGQLEQPSSSHCVNAKSILGHIYESHVRLLYKCSSCAKAFVNKREVYSHRQQHHPDATSNMPDFSLLYKAPFLKAPHNLFSTRQGFESHIADAIKRWTRVFMFKCYSCAQYFSSTEQLLDHNSLWCQIQYRQGPTLSLNSKLFSEPSSGQEQVSRPADMTDRDRHEEMIQHLAHLEALSTHCADCTKMTLDFRAHLTKHFAISTSRTTNPVDQDGPAPVKATRDQDNSVRVTRQRLEYFSKVSESNLTAPPDFNPPVEAAAEREEDNSSLSSRGKRGVGRPSLESTKSAKVKTEVRKPFVETLGIGVPSNKHLLALNRLNRNALAFGSTVVSKDRVQESDAPQREQQLACGVCDFSSYDRATFETHIELHRPGREVGQSGEVQRSEELAADCYQCKECGMCFASESSLNKHLLLLHSIRNAQTEQCPATNELNKEEADEASCASTDSGRLVIDDHACQICEQSFSSDQELRRHFRGHGMAFLRAHKSPRRFKTKGKRRRPLTIPNS